MEILLGLWSKVARDSLHLRHLKLYKNVFFLSYFQRHQIRWRVTSSPTSRRSLELIFGGFVVLMSTLVSESFSSKLLLQISKPAHDFFSFWRSRYDQKKHSYITRQLIFKVIYNHSVRLETLEVSLNKNL